MGKPKFSDDFNRDAVAQIAERGYPVSEFSKRLGVSQHSRCAWKRKFAKTISGETEKGPRPAPEAGTPPRDRGARHPKESHRVFRQGCKVRYAFVVDHRPRY